MIGGLLTYLILRKRIVMDEKGNTSVKWFKLKRRFKNDILAHQAALNIEARHVLPSSWIMVLPTKSKSLPRILKTEEAYA